MLSTTGFGDIAANNNAERVFCIVLFYVGVLLFGSLLVELQDIFAKASAHARERSVEINEMIEYLRHEDVPRSLEAQMVGWVDFCMRSEQSAQSKQKLLARAPPHLLRQLSAALHRGILTHVRIFAHLDEDLLLELWGRMRRRRFGAYVQIGAYGCQQDELFVIISGSVVLQQGPAIISTFKPGESFGEDWLLGVDREPEIVSAFRTADADRSGELDFDEFAALPHNQGIPKLKLRVMFDALDIDGSGTISLAELQQVT